MKIILYVSTLCAFLLISCVADSYNPIEINENWEYGISLEQVHEDFSVVDIGDGTFFFYSANPHSAYIISAAAKTFEPIVDLPFESAQSYIMTSLPNKEVLLILQHGNNHYEALKYSVSGNTWTQTVAPDFMPSRMLALPDGRVLAAKKQSLYLTKFYLFNQGIFSGWTDTELYHHGTDFDWLLVSDETVLVSGGVSGTYSTGVGAAYLTGTSSITKIDLYSITSTAANPMIYPRFSHTMKLLDTNRVLIFGHLDLVNIPYSAPEYPIYKSEIYHINEGISVETDSLPREISKAQNLSIKNINGDIYVFGSNSERSHNLVQKYDMESENWQIESFSTLTPKSVFPLPDGRTIVFLEDGKTIEIFKTGDMN